MNDWNWAEFQNKRTTNPPRPLLLKALELFNGFTGYTVELGCGSGIDTIHLLNSGWKVYAVDGTTNGFENVKSSISKNELPNVEFKQEYFEDLIIPDSDFVYASYSIPFCKEESFDMFWNRIVNSIKVGGRFAGHLYGEQDGWINYIKDITLKTRYEINSLFD